MKQYLILLPFALCCFIQNMAFTWSSRSRNSGDPNYHRFAALCSNSVYWICNLYLTIVIVKYLNTNIILIVLSGIVYTLSTAEGSVLMMKILLKHENGKRQVGSR